MFAEPAAERIGRRHHTGRRDGRVAGRARQRPEAETPGGMGPAELERARFAARGFRADRLGPVDSTLKGHAASLGPRDVREAFREELPLRRLGCQLERAPVSARSLLATPEPPE